MKGIHSFFFFFLAKIRAKGNFFIMKLFMSQSQQLLWRLWFRSGGGNRHTVVNAQIHRLSQHGRNKCWLLWLPDWLILTHGFLGLAIDSLLKRKKSPWEKGRAVRHFIIFSMLPLRSPLEKDWIWHILKPVLFLHWYQRFSAENSEWAPVQFPALKHVLKPLIFF